MKAGRGPVITLSLYPAFIQRYGEGRENLQRSIMKDVTAAIIIKAGKILIAKRGSEDRLAHKWEFPGGKIEEGETPRECLRREIKEELRIDVAVGEFLGESIYHYSHGSIRLLAFRAYWQSGDIWPEAHAEFSWVSPEQLPDYEFSAADVPFVEKLRRGEIVV